MSDTRALALAMPALALIVAAHQIHLVRTANLSRWKGGGMGMFSTIDSPHARFSHIEISTRGASYVVESPTSLQPAEFAARVEPSERRLKDLAASILHGTWASRLDCVARTDSPPYLCERWSLTSVGGSDAEEALQVDRVSVEIRRIVVRVGLELTVETLGEVTIAQ